MPSVESYVAEVTVTVVLKSTTAGRVGEVSVTRTAKGTSGQNEASKTVEQALTNASAAARILSHGLDNTEARRLK